MLKQESKVLNVKVTQNEKELFLKICKQNDTTASREVRKFIRDYIQKHAQMDWTV